MNWSRIKSVMIIILLVGNIALAYTLVSRYRNVNYISEESLVTVQDILEKSGVSFGLDIIDRKKPGLYIYEAIKGDDYQTTVASELSGSTPLGKLPTLVGFIVPMENGNIYEFEKGFSFSYIQNNDDADWYNEVFNSASQRSEDLAEVKNTAELKKIVWNFISRSSSTHNSSSDSGKSGISIIRTLFYEEKKCYIISAAQTMDDTEIAGNTTLFIIKEGESEVSAAKGTWCFVQIEKRYSSQLYDQLNILFNEKKRADSLSEAPIFSDEENTENTEDVENFQIFAATSDTEAKAEAEDPEKSVSGIVPVNEFVAPLENNSDDMLKASDSDKGISSNSSLQENSQNTDQDENSSGSEASDGKENDEKVVITSLKLCYCLYQSQGSSGNHIFFIPGWEITRKDGSFTIYDGRNGGLYTNIERKSD